LFACHARNELIERYGADMRLPDLREEIAQCERRGLMHLHGSLRGFRETAGDEKLRKSRD